MKIRLLLFVFLFSLLLKSILVFSVDVTDCKSGTLNWLCDRGKVCVCEISDSCTNGNLLIYDEYPSNPLCSPQIINNRVTINWVYCNTTKDYVKARADCDEGQSPEKMIILTGEFETTTTIITTTSTTTTIYGVCGLDGYCEFTENECLEGYEDCPEYDVECSGDEKCCCSMETTTTTQRKLSGFSYGWLILPVLIIIGIFVYFFFIRKKKSETIKKFRRLYEKWSR